MLLVVVMGIGVAAYGRAGLMPGISALVRLSPDNCMDTWVKTEFQFERLKLT